MRTAAVLIIGLLALTSACGGGSPPSEPSATSETAAAAEITAAPVPPNSRIGALFLGAGDLHTCTAAVLDSAGGDLILTAAHCVAEGIDTTSSPDSPAMLSTPADTWKVDARLPTAHPRRATNQDPLADFAILRVLRDDGRHCSKPRPAADSRSAPRQTGHRRHGHRVRAGRRRRSDRLPGGHGAGAGWLPVAAVQRDDRRHQRCTVDHRADHHRSGRRARRRRMRRKRLVFTTIGRRGRCVLRRAEAGGPADPAPAVFDDEC